ncbi:family 16 glycoside hydrolase [Paenibacillus filicis]|uniref:Family 16 glycoside hydrolase n=1 Tax=Paenibacillus filicis TaxID=669464 RepID=A0ABU9DMQ1_9BACL
MKTSKVFLLAIALLLTVSWFIHPTADAAAEKEIVIKESAFNPADILKTDSATNSVLTNKASFRIQNVAVNTAGRVTKVVIREKGSKVERATLTNNGDGTFRQTADIAPSSKVEATAVQEIPAGYFEWFRDPNKYVWMYDYEGTRNYRDTRWSVYSRPPATCKKASSVTDQNGSAMNGNCNDAEDYRTGTITVSTFELPGNLGTVNLNDLGELKFDETTFKLTSTGTLKQGNNIRIISSNIDPVSKHYRFDYRMSFDAEPDWVIQGDNDPNGRVIRWDNEWNAIVKGYVYKYPEMEVVAYIDDTPLEKPDLIPTVLKIDEACFKVGDTIRVRYGYTNVGLDIKNKPFKVTLSAGGTVIKTENAEDASRNVLLGGFVDYKVTGNSVTFKLKVDVDNTIDEGPLGETNNELSKTFTASSNCNEGGDTEIIKANFNIVHPVITFGESNTFQPTGTSVTGAGCTVKELKWTVTQNGKSYSWTSTQVNATGVSTFPPSPDFLTVGTVSVSMEVTSTCGTKASAGTKTFEIIRPAACTPDNRPPVFEIGWFDAYDSGSFKPKTKGVEGDKLWLRVIKKPILGPGSKAEPYDPDGDQYFLTWDFEGSSSDWVKYIYKEYGLWKHEPDGFTYNFKSVQGTHSIKATATDVCGNQSQSTASIFILPENPPPIPMIDLPPKVIEGRPYTPEISCGRSYSPRDDRSISECKWTGKQPRYLISGFYPITLEVRDNTGLWSESPAYATLPVLPDLPPVVEATLPSKGVRGTPMNMADTSYSPDGDQIVIHKTQIIADVNMNGNFDDDPVIDVTLDESGNFSFTPTVLANHILRLFVQEDWGLKANKDFPFTIVNQAPTVAIDVKGEYPEPPTIEGIKYELSQMLNDKSQFVIEDHYNSHTSTTMYYDAAEGSIAVPARDKMLYKAPTAEGFQFSQTGLNMRGSSEYGEYKPLGDRAGQNIYYTWSTFYDCTGSTYCTPYGISISFNNAVTNSTQMYKSRQYGDYIQFNINPNADLVWLRTSKSDVRNSNPSGNYDQLFRISDMASGNFTPFKTIPFTVTSWHYLGQYQWTQVPDNPPPVGWIPNEDIKENVVINQPWNFEVAGVRSLINDVITPRKDNDGNFYAFSCTSTRIQMGWENDSPVMGDKYDCKLQKISPSGIVLWTGNKVYTNYYMGSNAIAIASYPRVDIVHITSDNSRILLNDGVYDNLTGQYLGQIPGYDYSSYMGVGHPYMVRKGYAERDHGFVGGKFYHDLYYYVQAIVTERYSCGDDSTCEVYTDYHRIFNLRTMQLTLNLAGAEYDGKSSWEYRLKFTGDTTSDGKLVLPYRDGKKRNDEGFKPRIRVYEMETGQLLFESPMLTGFTNPDSCAVWQQERCYGSISLKLTGDTEGYLMWSDNGNYFARRKVSWSIPTVSDAGTYSLGNVMDTQRSFANGSLSLSLKYTNTIFSDLSGAGITFRSADNKNYYQAELTTKTVVLSKVVNGVKTILDRQTNPIKPGTYNNLRVSAKGDRLHVYVNGVPMISVTDGTFTSGRIGLFANAPNVYLKNFFLENASGGSELVDNIVLVNGKINYTVDFRDPENDPPIPELAQWTYTNTEPEKFLDARDGYSDKNGANTYVNRVVNSPEAVLGKVGLFRISFTEPDDPAPPGKRYPDPTYAAFRQYADPDTKMVIVHRRPISVFTAAQKADFTIVWTDASYDPDRWLSPSQISGEKAEYVWNRGIYDYVHGYTDPDGKVGIGKLTRPTKQGNYTLRQAVKDEYGAWSDWYEVNLWIDQPVPNNPPSVTLTFPSGSYADPSHVSLKPTIRWNQSDPDPDTTFTLFNLTVKDEAGNCVECKNNVVMNTKNTSWAWTLDTQLQMGKKYQVQVQVVDDGNLSSAWSNIGWMTTNSPPTAFMSYPWGTEAQPTIVNTTRPTLTWTQNDPDPGWIIEYFQIQVSNADHTTIVLDSHKTWQNSTSTSGSWTVNADLPTGQKLRVRVKVWDQYGAESDWSPQVWMFINRPPTGNLIFVQPIYEHDTPLFTIEQSDPDGDALTVRIESSFQGGDFMELHAWGQVPSGESKSFSYGPLQEGTYTLRLTLTDPHGGQFQQSYTFPVLPLKLTGWVRHTPEWERYLREWNTKFPARERAEDDFWAGEAFVLSASVTDTGTSLTKPTSVTAKLLSTEETVLLSLEPVSGFYTGMLLNTDHVRTLAQGAQSFRFTVTWSNGLIRHYEVPIRIVGSIYDVIVQQIRH